MSRERHGLSFNNGLLEKRSARFRPIKCVFFVYIAGAGYNIIELQNKYLISEGFVQRKYG